MQSYGKVKPEIPEMAAIPQLAVSHFYSKLFTYILRYYSKKTNKEKIYKI